MLSLRLRFCVIWFQLFSKYPSPWAICQEKKWLHAAVSEIKRTAVKMASAMAFHTLHCLGFRENFSKTCMVSRHQEQLSWGKIKVWKSLRFGHQLRGFKSACGNHTMVVLIFSGFVCKRDTLSCLYRGQRVMTEVSPLFPHCRILEYPTIPFIF